PSSQALGCTRYSLVDRRTKQLPCRGARGGLPGPNPLRKRGIVPDGTRRANEPSDKKRRKRGRASAWIVHSDRLGERTAVRLLDVEQLDLEEERRVRRNHAARSARDVTEIRRNQERTLAADLHRRDALVPSLDHAALPDRERERRSAIERAVELLALGSV